MPILRRRRTFGTEAMARPRRTQTWPKQGTLDVPKVGAARMETSMQMPAQAEMVQQQQYAASVGTDQQPSMLLQPQVTRRLTWQEHLVGWQIQVEQYTSGARTHRTTHTARA